MITLFEKHSELSWLVTIIIALGIFYMSSLIFPPTSQPSFWQPIIYHFAVFAALSFFLSISLVKGKSRNLIYLAIFLAFAYAISDEIHQIFVPTRTCSFFDIFIDCVGIITAATFYAITLKLRKRI